MVLTHDDWVKATALIEAFGMELNDLERKFVCRMCCAYQCGAVDITPLEREALRCIFISRFGANNA